MRVGTYNIQAMRGYPQEVAAREIGRGESRAAAAHFTGVFRELSCHILALQEGVSARQAQRVARAVGQNLVTFPSPLHWPGHLLTRYPVIESRLFGHWTPNADRRPFSRAGGAALLDLRPNRRLWVLNLHLHPRYDDIREEETAIVAGHLRTFLAEADHVIVAGDFNSPPGAPLHRVLEQLSFANALAAATGTIPATHDTMGRVAYPVDHIYISRSLAPCLRGAWRVEGPGFGCDAPPPAGRWLHSDHYPLVAELALD